jgi:hypothetical protein
MVAIPWKSLLPNTFARKQIIFETKRTHYLEQKLFSKQSEHVYVKEPKNRSEAKVVNIKL